MSLLRRELGHRLQRTAGGYRLAVADDEFDVTCFEADARSGQQALRAGNVDVAVDAFGRALSRWRGGALADVAEARWAAGDVARLGELRASVLEGWFEARSLAGGDARLVGDLEAALVADPLRERMWGQLMLALYRSGRQSDSLRAFQRVRSVLGAQLGIEPSAELVALDEAIVLQKPHLAGDGVAAVRTAALDAPAGNLPVQSTSFVGRDLEVAELTAAVRVRRLVTLTGAGGVGKTRLAVQVAGQLVPEFADGVWLVELAPVSDPGAVADAVASVLGVAPQAGLSVTASVAQALAGRRLLVVLDNCEHVLDAVAEFVDTVLARTSSVKVLATSREGLRVGAEQLWPVPSLDGGDAGSAAVELFVDRARAVTPGFALRNDADTAAVVEICRRLDGLPLAIELAAARMVSMHPTEVRDRLGDRFRLLATGRRGSERHQTLRRAVGWSYDLLGEDERDVLQRCSVFAGGFDLAAAVKMCAVEFDEYAVLDVLDSLVRKSLMTVEETRGPSRYGLLETIRQFAQDQLDATGAGDEVRHRHAHVVANEAVACWRRWDGPGYRAAVDWVEAEFDNLRAAFRWAADHGDVNTATATAAHTTMLAFALQRYEPVGWVEEILPAATAADVAQLPRLYTAGAHCVFVGRPDDAVGYAQKAHELDADPRYDGFEPAWAAWRQATGHLYAGRVERYVQISTDLAAQSSDLAHVSGLCGMLYGLPTVGQADKAITIADETIAAAHAHANPVWIALALAGYGRAHTHADPTRALTTLPRRARLHPRAPGPVPRSGHRS